VPDHCYILIVDDEEELRDLLKELLEASYPTVVLHATDGEEARLLLQTCVFDLVIADIHMPRCDGVELFRWVMEHIPDLQDRFIFLTAAGREPQVVNRLAELPPVRVLHKPFFITELVDLVRNTLKPSFPSVPWDREAGK
jgi:CheY-like chemotaxis protein